MVEVERSHSHSGVGSCCTSDFCDFFLCCFSSRRSSSMKMSSSKSILSPGRGREPPTLSLSSSLSRRLRSNGSMKGGQASPMFATGSGKKSEPPEPSSPKVTCIGQVRVKSKRRHGRNKLRNNRSQRRGEVSFRKTEQNQEGGNGIHHQQSQQTQQECLRHRNQRWVHLPLSICETLRSFGADFNCFGPCGGRRSSSSCSWSNEREKSEKRKRTSSSSSNSCGAVFARWLFALEESEEKGKVIETHEEEPVMVRNEVEKRVYREENRGVVEMEITEEKMESRGRVEEDEVEEEEEEEARESICIPPKNALLLMRSRSAPFRMSSLANRFWDSPAPQDKEEDLEEEEDDDEFEVHNNGENKEIREDEDRISEQVEMKSDLEEDEMVDSLKEEQMQDVQPKEDEIKEEIKQKEGILRKKFSSEASLEEAMLEMDEREAKMQVEVVEKKEKRRVSFSSSTMYLEPESESELEEEEEVDTILEERSQKSTEEESSVSVSVSEDDEKEIPSRSTTTDADQDQEDEQQISNVKNHEEMEEEEEEKSLLPDCLLLMMCEPKLSMEVSKETWVCSRDFIRFRHSEKKVVPQKTNVVVGDESTKKRLSTDTNPIPKPTQPLKKQQKQQQKSSPAIQVQPARSSCSKVEPLVAAIEKKLTDSRAAYEPFVLKRCKSEPMRNSAKLAPEVCFWNKNKIEANHHHQPPSVGVGATGVGF